MSCVVIGRGVSYELATGRELFTNLDFELGACRAALVGSNGVGKSTLARLIVGELEPSSGHVRRHSSIKMLRQYESPPSVSVGEYLATHYEWSRRGERLLEHIAVDGLCSDLSGGEWMRVRLASILGGDFLILDEPTNDLDREGRQIVYDFLRSSAQGVLLISHDRECLQLCDEVFELANGGLSRFGGSWADYVAHRDRERARLRSALMVAKRERDAAHAHRIEQQARQERRNRLGVRAAAKGGTPKILLGARKRRAEASTGKLNVATSQQASDAVRRAYEAFARLKEDAIMNAELLGAALPAQKLVAEAHGFNIRLRHWLYAQDLDFSWRGSVRIALQGPNGAGKSTLLKALAGTSFVTRGELRRGDLATLFIDQRCAGLDPQQSVLQNVQCVSSRSETDIRNELARFLFVKEQVFQPVHTLSGGERLRAALAQGFLAVATPQLLLLDEPTNNLDLSNIEFLEQLLRAFRGALIVVSHDRTFLERCEVANELRLAA